MDNEFTATEIEEAITAARFFSPDYGQEQFQASRELERRLAESGYLGVVQALARLEKEKGIPFTEALDTYERLLQDSAELEQKVNDYRATLEMVEGEVTQAQDKLRQVEEALEQTKAEREREEKELAAFRKRAEREKKRIDEELEQCRQEANVTKEEITTAVQLKAEVGKYGFSLDLALGLSQEFAGYENMRDELARALKEGKTLTKYNEQAEGRKDSLQTDIEALAGDRQQLESNLSQLRADVAFEEELRQFYHRYQGAGVLMDQLVTWRNIFFGRCSNPLYAVTGALDRSTSSARFWTEKPIRRCPCCDYPGADWDASAYQAVGQPVGTPLQLKLGE